MTDADLIRRALEEIPVECRYHGDQLERPERWARFPHDPCCDTGRPSLYRRVAEAALERLLEDS